MGTERSTTTDITWYPIRIAYGRERRVQAFLDAFGEMETFLPMHTVMRTTAAGPRPMQVPVVRNLLFVRAAFSRLSEARTRLAATSPFHFILDRETCRPLTIAADAMDRFRRVCEGEESPEYMDAAAARLRKGARVRITGGPWAGLEGSLVRVGGKRRVMVALPGLFAVLTAAIPPQLVEVLDA